MSELDEQTEIERLNRELAIITRMIVEERKIFFLERARVKELESKLESIQASQSLAEISTDPHLLDQSPTKSGPQAGIFRRIAIRLLKFKFFK